MPFVDHQMTALIKVNPEEARRLILDAFRKAGTSRRGAAEILGCHEGTFVVWARSLGLLPEFRKLELDALKNGWHHGRNRLGGRAVGSKNAPKVKGSKSKRRTKPGRSRAAAQ